MQEEGKVRLLRESTEIHGWSYSISVRPELERLHRVFSRFPTDRIVIHNC